MYEPAYSTLQCLPARRYAAPNRYTFAHNFAKNANRLKMFH